MARHGLIRASDADRDAVVDRLREAAGEGRLEPAELEERVAAALRARTYGELDWLVADLPGNAVGHRHRPGGFSLRRATRIGAGALVALTLALAVVAIVALLVFAVAAWWVFLIIAWMVVRGPGGRRCAWHYRGRRAARV
jgi:hypothetical protein